MVNKIIKSLCPIIQVLIVVAFVVISIPKDDTDASFVTNNIDSDKTALVSSGLFVSSDILEDIEEDNTDIVSSSVEVKSDILNENIDNFTNDYVVIDTYIGTLTGYGPDCKGCKTGKTSSGYQIAEVIDGIVQPAFTITYDDEEYGNVRILAAAYSKFPNGSIIRVSDFEHFSEPFIGIVLDTGSTMRNNWESNSYVWIDLLFASESDPDIKSFGIDKNVTFDILRYGY